MKAVQTLQFVKKKIPAWVTGSVVTPAGNVQSIASDWTSADYRGMIRSRISAFRMNYSVPPGLYAIGNPTPASDVFVTANYKLTFDILRRELKGMHAWVLVLDTKSINVWCAAGKGTFGTDELIKRIAIEQLDRIVSHRRLILPQLGAVGINAAAVQRKTGFRISFGPVQARDIPAYLRNGYKKTPDMTEIRFTMFDRLVLTPMEIIPAMKKFPWVAAGFLFIFGLQPTGVIFRDAWTNGLPFLLMTLLAVLTGAFLTPVLLPYIPFRSFAIKGLITGVVSVFLALQVSRPGLSNPLLLAVIYLLFPALSSYIALQFTGSTTFTGMSGVNKELKYGIPLYAGASGVSAMLLILYKLGEWGLI